MKQGIVKWFNREKGYGFINSEEESKDIFVHFSAIQTEKKSLTTGDKVQFELHSTHKGFQAKNVVLVA